MGVVYKARQPALDCSGAGDAKPGLDALPQFEHKWSHAAGSVLVFVYTKRTGVRSAFVELVGRVRKKLGLPAEEP